MAHEKVCVCADCEDTRLDAQRYRKLKVWMNPPGTMKNDRLFFDDVQENGFDAAVNALPDPAKGGK